MLEYPVYGSLHSFLVCKRLGRISDNSSQWEGIKFQQLEANILRALPDENRQFLSHLLDSASLRSQPFKGPLNANFRELDLLLMALQICSGMQFLTESGVSGRGLPTFIRPLLVQQ